MIELVALILAIAGFVMLSLSMHRHHLAMFDRPLTKGWALIYRCLGGSLLLVSLIPPVLTMDISVGLVLWFGLLTIAAWTVLLVYVWRDVTGSAKRR